MPEPRLWTKDFVGGALTNFFLVLAYFILIVVVASYAMSTFGSSPSEAGLAAGLFVVGALTARLFGGLLIHCVGHKGMLFAGITLSLTMTVLYLIANSIWVLYVVRFLHGVGYGIASVAIVTIVTSIIPKARHGEGIGYYMLSLNVGSAIGPFLAMFIMQHGSFTLIFIICIISVVLSLVSAFSISVPEISATDQRSDETKGLQWSHFLEVSAIPISVVGALVYFAYASTTSFLTPYAQEINLVDAASLFFLVFSFAIVVSRPTVGRLFDSKGENHVMYPAFLVFAIGLILLSQADRPITLLIAAMLCGLGFGIVQSCGMAIALKATPPHRFSFASSTFYVFIDAGSGIGPFILGFFIPFTGYRGMYMGVAVVTFTCILIYHVLHGRKAAPMAAKV